MNKIKLIEKNWEKPKDIKFCERIFKNEEILISIDPINRKTEKIIYIYENHDQIQVNKSKFVIKLSSIEINNMIINLKKEKKINENKKEKLHKYFEEIEDSITTYPLDKYVTDIYSKNYYPEYYYCANNEYLILELYIRILNKKIKILEKINMEKLEKKEI